MKHLFLRRLDTCYIILYHMHSYAIIFNKSCHSVPFDLALQEVTDLDFSFSCAMMIGDHRRAGGVVPVAHVEVLGQIDR